MFKTGYITNFWGDLFLFLGMPFLALALALVCQSWLSAVALAAIATWITFPHHFATWMRTYAMPEDWKRFRGRLIVGPILIAATTWAGLQWAPLSLLLMIVLWDHQHSLMQQHGFARIYDFKAKTGTPATGRYDLALAWILYGNLLLTTPFFTSFWIRECYNFGFAITAETVRTIQIVSWTVTIGYLLFYVSHIVQCVRQGVPLNPLKYAFIAASYFLWYFVSWQTDSLLVHGIAHRTMHGIQYIAIVMLYLQHTSQRPANQAGWFNSMFKPANISAFVILALGYTVAYKLIVQEPLSDFTFGAATFTRAYDQSIPAFGMGGLSPEQGYTLFATLVTYSVQLLHFYVDSFIWKVRDKQVQSAL